MKTIQHTVVIPGPPAAVWRTLTDTDRYPEWNPFITRLDGDLRPGNRLTVTVQAGTRSLTFRPTVDHVQPERHLRWRGRLGLPGILDGCHEFLIDPRPDGTTAFTQRETFEGIVVPLLGRTLRDTAEGFATMNQALDGRVRSTAAPAS